ncbi:hypothetical protein CB1_002192001 [Camelus ferus]|nr:hypothetical protein CB1_002192001 [Camelus ferus]
MKKRRKGTSHLDEKIHLGYHKESAEGHVSVECGPRKLLSSLQYNKNLLKYLNDDRQKQPSFCDLLIIVEGKEFSAHKVVVAVGSSYFHACLSKNPSTDVVTLDHSELIEKRSKRNRKCPVKFDDTSDDEQESGDGSDSLNQGSFEKDKADRNDSEDPGSEYNAEEDELEEEMSDESSDIEEQSEKDQNDGEEEPEARDSVGSIQEVLTPVVIQNRNKKILQCPKCDKTFDRIGPFPCDICGRQFNDTGNLKRHIECTHGGKRKWTCFICGKSVRESHCALPPFVVLIPPTPPTSCSCSTPVRRMTTLGGEKPYKCQICNQSFRIKKTLTKHLVIHSDARPFNCQHCNATFKRKDKLKYHIDHVHGIKSPDDPLSASEEKLVSLPAEYSSDDKIFQAETKQYMDQPKVYQSEAKTMLQNVSAEVCVPVTLVPVQMPDTQSDLVRHTTTLPPPPHEILSPQPQSADYPRAADLAFLEKYTLTPQPANIVHPVRPEQMLDPREQSYLGTLLGLDNATAVQSISNSEHHS